MSGDVKETEAADIMAEVMKKRLSLKDEIKNEEEDEGK